MYLLIIQYYWQTMTGVLPIPSLTKLFEIMAILDQMLCNYAVKNMF